ncbi:hypothetical protein [Arthrobacter sp. Rue61a]|uniref:hypothetical protein n=1 Tax=Arthrobacter sp. Rue61a TaxID=1118963 RepID=UPI0005BDA2A6|nr:hypothetical protein [Arthrobacter sp. Rue61a]
MTKLQELTDAQAANQLAALRRERELTAMSAAHTASRAALLGSVDSATKEEWQTKTNDPSNMWALNYGLRGDGRTLIPLVGDLLCRFVELKSHHAPEIERTSSYGTCYDLLFKRSFFSFKDFEKLILKWSDLKDAERGEALGNLAGEMQAAQSELLLTAKHGAVGG